MKSRDATIAELAESIVDGTFSHSRISLATILNERSEVLFDDDDTASLITGDAEARADILSRAEGRAREIVTEWLTYSVRGRVLVNEVMEQERADELEDQL